MMIHDRDPLGGPVDDCKAVSLPAVAGNDGLVSSQPTEEAAIPVRNLSTVYGRFTSELGTGMLKRPLVESGWKHLMRRL